ncbi:MAG: hypothetical protein H0U95_02490 [Bacteroidetes bacterium]|nr:hypothetical protein [Bacteroidota bacterium]
MRKVEFEVPTEVFGAFTEKLTETGLNNRVLGKNEDDEIEIEVYYEKDEAAIIDELEEYLEELIDNIEEEEEDEDEK